MYGKVLATQPFMSNLTEIDVAGLPSGVYLLSLRPDKGLPMVKKFVLLH